MVTPERTSDDTAVREISACGLLALIEAAVPEASGLRPREVGDLTRCRQVARRRSP